MYVHYIDTWPMIVKIFLALSQVDFHTKLKKSNEKFMKSSWCSFLYLINFIYQMPNIFYRSYKDVEEGEVIWGKQKSKQIQALIVIKTYKGLKARWKSYWSPLAETRKQVILQVIILLIFYSPPPILKAASWTLSNFILPTIRERYWLWIHIMQSQKHTQLNSHKLGPLVRVQQSYHYITLSTIPIVPEMLHLRLQFVAKLYQLHFLFLAFSFWYFES